MSVKRTGLGKNLSALLHNSGHSLALKDALPKIPDQKPLSLPEITKLPLASLRPGKYQPRRTMEEGPLQELAASIKKQGLLQPILVRRLEGPEQNYEIIAGERRFKACQRAGLSEVPVVLQQVDDETAMALALIENIQREDLNPIDHARAIARLVQEFSLTHQEIAELLSKSRTAVTNLLRLLSLSPEVLLLVEKGALDMGHARALLSLESAQQVSAAEQVLSKNLSVRDTESLVKRLKTGALLEEERVEPRHKAFDYTLALQQKMQALEAQLQTKVHLKQGDSGKGKLVIHYDSLQFLENLLFQMVR